VLSLEAVGRLLRRAAMKIAASRLPSCGFGRERPGTVILRSWYARETRAGEHAEAGDSCEDRRSPIRARSEGTRPTREPYRHGHDERRAPRLARPGKPTRAPIVVETAHKLIGL